MTAEQIDEVLNYLSSGEDGNHMLALFYTFFYHLRPPLIQGVHNEAAKTIEEVLALVSDDKRKTPELTAMGLALRTAGYNPDERGTGDETDAEKADGKFYTRLEKFLCITAICSKFGLPLPSSMAFRLSGALDYDNMRVLSAIPFFIYPDTEKGDFAYCIRTKLEANLLLQYFHVDIEEEVALISDLILYIRDASYYNQEAEVKTVSELLYKIGPNTKSKSKKSNRRNIQSDRRYKEYYPQLIDALRELRTARGILEPHLVLREINLIREYYAGKDSKYSNDMVAEKLRLAIDIGTRALYSVNNSFSVTVNDMLIVEVANSRIRLCDCEQEKETSLQECALARQDIETIWRHNHDNSYAYSTWLHAALHEYRSYGEDQHVERAELLADMCDLINRVETDNPDIAEFNEFFIEPATEAKEILGTEAADAYFDKLIEAGSSAGIFIRANKLLSEIETVQDNKKFSDSAIRALEKICSDLLENPAYAHLISISSECQFLLIQQKWKIYNGEPLFKRLSLSTYMDQEQWQEIQILCEHFKTNFIDTRTVEGYVSNTVLFVLALSYAQTEKYGECLKISTILRRSTELWNRQMRIMARYYICDSEGVPLEFSGEFVGDVQKDRGYVKIHKLVKYLPSDRPGVYVSRYDINRSDPSDSGTMSVNFQLGLGYMGFSAHLGKKEGKRNA